MKGKKGQREKEGRYGEGWMEGGENRMATDRQGVGLVERGVA